MISRVVNIDLINIFLMIISFCAALYLPIETFLLAYAVLGPLHYLTEINWLKNKNFFLKTKNQSNLLIALGCVSFLLIAFNFESLGLLNYLMLWVVFFLPLYFMLEKKHKNMLIIISVGLISWSFFNEIIFNIASIFLFTIIHVYVFTGLFILLGSIKNKSFLGYISLALYLLLPLSYFFIFKELNYSELTNIDEYKFSIGKTVEELSKLFFEGSFSIEELNKKTELILIAKFVAFAYTYHYLNWFSKTKVIGWFENDKLKIFLIILIWLASIGTYFYDYILGFKILLLLSFIHVVLEFPLNWISIKTLIK